MQATGKNGLQAWIWAIVINLLVFALIWFAFLKIPISGTVADQPDTPPVGPGSTFGQMTHLISVEESVVADDLPVTTAQTEIEFQWISEFYLDRGPALSYAPRLNSDGSARPHPPDQDWAKSPTYEDDDTQLTADDINYPVVTPQYFSKRDLPAEFRDLNFDLTVSIHLDTRGHVIGVPEIIRGSGHRVVDEITVDKIMNEATFTPATRKDTGQPVRVRIPFPIWWRDSASQ